VIHTFDAIAFSGTALRLDEFGDAADRPEIFFADFRVAYFDAKVVFDGDDDFEHIDGIEFEAAFTQRRFA
jgi:hypothetical protein